MKNLLESIMDMPYGESLTIAMIEAYDTVFGLYDTVNDTVFEAVNYDVQNIMDMVVLNFDTPKGNNVDVTLTPENNGVWDVAFTAHGSYDDTGEGDIEVVRMALASVLDYFQKVGYPKQIVFRPFKGKGDYKRQHVKEFEYVPMFIDALGKLMQVFNSKSVKLPGARMIMAMKDDLDDYSRYGKSIFEKVLNTAVEMSGEFSDEVKPYLEQMQTALSKMHSVGDVNRRRNIYTAFVKRACPTCRIDVGDTKGGAEKIIVTPPQNK